MVLNVKSLQILMVILTFYFTDDKYTLERESLVLRTQADCTKPKMQLEAIDTYFLSLLDRRMTDSIDKRFCFDITAQDR